MKRWIRALRTQPRAHIPGLSLAGQPVRHDVSHPCRPSVPRAKTKVFAQEARHLRRRGTSMCLAIHSYHFMPRCRPARAHGKLI